jgi:hypothetical protein
MWRGKQANTAREVVSCLHRQLVTFERLAHQRPHNLSPSFECLTSHPLVFRGTPQLDPSVLGTLPFSFYLILLLIILIPYA